MMLRRLPYMNLLVVRARTYANIYYRFEQKQDTVKRVTRKERENITEMPIEAVFCISVVRFDDPASEAMPII